MTKTERLKKLLKRQWVTPLECLEQCGLMTLSQRCSDFRAAGVNVIDKWVDLPSGARVKSYRIVGHA